MDMLNMKAAREWLTRSESSLKKAQLGQTTRDILWEDFCLDLHQTVEKGLKALYAAKERPIPETLLIKELLPGIRKMGYRLPVSDDDLLYVDKYYEETRVPTGKPRVTKEEYLTKLKTVTQFFQFVKKYLA